MGRNNTDDFDLGGLEEFEEPSFAGDDNDFLPPEPAGPRGTRNTLFLLIVALLIFFIVIPSIIAIIFFALQFGENQGHIRETANAVYATNTAVQVAINATMTANSWTKTPTPTDTPTFTPTFTETASVTPSDTPTSTPSELPTTEIGPLPTTEVGITLTPSDTPTVNPAISAADLTNTQFAMQATNVAATLTALAQQSITPSIAPTGGGPTQEGGATKTRTPQLPTGGIFEDMAQGKASPGSLAFVGFAALGLVAIIVVARRLRVKS